MAGDWIKIKRGTLDSAELFRASELANLSIEKTLFCILKTAEWMSEHSEHGVMRNFPAKTIDAVTKEKGVSDAFIDLKWIKQCEGGFMITSSFPCSQGYARKGFSARFRKSFLHGKTCAKCGSGEFPEIDHILPVSSGGSHKIENLQVLCRKCNRRKSSK